MDTEEKAADLLAGGIMQQGYQCGMLWGASLALGAEASRRYKDRNQAIAVAILATRHIMQSFVKTAGIPDCEEITQTDWSKKFSTAKYLITGKAFACFKLAEKWAPHAFKTAEEGLATHDLQPPTDPVVSCATETARLMGASDEEMIMVAGFAGGIGLSGKGCGALAAAIWMNNLRRLQSQSSTPGFNDKETAAIIEAFYKQADYQMECQEITGTRSSSAETHTDYIQNGGCRSLIEHLANSASPNGL